MRRVHALNRGRKGAECVKKSIFLLFFLLFFTACSLELSEEEMEGRLIKIAGRLPATAAGEVDLTQTVSGGARAYSAVVQLTWSEMQGRFSTEKALAKYSRQFADEVTQRIPSISTLSLAWVVPFHSKEETAMRFSYQRRKEGLTQIALEDRFTDGTFGADAFIDPNAMVEVPVRRLEPSETTPQEAVLPASGTAPESSDETAPPAGSPADNAG